MVFSHIDQYHSLKEQLPDVKRKYLRRINRFYEDIKRPTLFISYISDEAVNDEGKAIELEYIEKNHLHILSVLKSFHEDNDIMYIANCGVTSNLINIYHVEKDENDCVARRPLDKNAALNERLMSFDFRSRQSNLAVFYKKEKKRKNPFVIIYKKGCAYFKQKLLHEYVHERTISHGIEKSRTTHNA